jgi:intracellular sulfur oxidation DsrE/DsrF family protein
MRTAAIGLTTDPDSASGSFGPANADSDKAASGAWLRSHQDLPGARELPDPKTDYKVVFADGQDAKNPGDVNPMLPTIATYVNTLGKYGVPAEHRHIVIMFHQRTPDIDIVMTNEAYKERYNRDNPNIAIIHALKQAGVDIRVCGQGLIGRKIDSKQVNPDVQIDLWAMTTLVQPAAEGIRRASADRSGQCIQRWERHAAIASTILIATGT